jgi:hypothetical protein
MDKDLPDRVRLDGIVTVVSCQGVCVVRGGKQGGVGGPIRVFRLFRTTMAQAVRATAYVMVSIPDLVSVRREFESRQGSPTPGVIGYRN